VAVMQYKIKDGEITLVMTATPNGIYVEFASADSPVIVINRAKWWETREAIRKLFDHCDKLAFEKVQS
jgi:hypothetical protein